MKFKHKLYHYQQDVIEIFHKEVENGEKKIHIVAPPGSGKTIMGLEIISQIKGNHLILVPNLTLQYQWKDKLEKMFLEYGDSIEDIVSLSTQEIKKINIITYQSLTQTSRDNDLVYEKIINFWYNDFKNDFKSKKEFLLYIEGLKDLEIDLYRQYFSRYKKKVKLSGEAIFSNLLSEKVLDYLSRLKKNSINSIIVDESHHLTNWWSKTIYYFWEELGKSNSSEYNRNFKVKDIGNAVTTGALKIINNKKYGEYANFPFIIGLTATPPYDDADFFILDDDYSKLLGEVDYYVPTPAVIKSGRLAPYSDLVYFVEPDSSLKIELDRIDLSLNKYIGDNKDIISKYIFSVIEKDYDIFLGQSHNLLLNYLKFLNTYSSIDITNYYFDDKIGENITLQDIAKTIGNYIYNLSLKTTRKKEVEKTKKIFYELGYIWRGRNFYRFRTKVEKLLIYGQSKINGVKAILDKEIKNLGGDLKCTIITDFLEEKEGMISCKFILKNLVKYRKLNPILVSGQGIWKLGKSGELIEIDSNILKITEEFLKGNTKLLIGTRGILGEGWDAPKLNTLIDLTGIVAYMSVNQVRGRAIRCDKGNFKKVANIYDIVTIYDGYSKDVDLARLERKHEQFYGVDDTGLIIKGVNHIYPNLLKHYKDYINISQNMLKRSELRSYYYKLWEIGGKYGNKEVFGLDLEINNIGKIFPFINYRIYDSFSFFSLVKKQEKLDDLMISNFYKEIIKRFLKVFLKNIVKTQISLGFLPKDFSYNLIESKIGNYKLVSNYKDDLIIKKFMLDISIIFKKIGTQKYILKYPVALYNGNKIIKHYLYFGLPDSLSKNKKIRATFKKELENDFLKAGLLFNPGSILNNGLKLPIVGAASYGISTMVTYLASSFSIATITTVAASPIITSIFPIAIVFFIYFLPKDIVYKDKKRLVNEYKILFKAFLKYNYKFNFQFIYLNSKDTAKDYFIGKKPFIESKIEKIWM